MPGTLKSSLELRVFSEEHLAACNVLYRAPLVIDTQWLSSRWECNFQHAVKPSDFSVQIVVNWSGAKVIVRTCSAWLDKLAASLTGGADIVSLPKLIQIAIAETTFGGLVEQIEFVGKRRLRIESIEIDKGALATRDDLMQMSGLQWQAECDGFLYRGEIWLDCNGFEQAAELSRARNSCRRAKPSWVGLPVPIRFLVGQTILSSSSYLSLELNDVVLLDDAWLTEEGILTASLGHGIAFRGRIDGTQLIVMEGLKRMMDDPTYDEQLGLDTDEKSLVSALPVNLTFDLGERTMQIGELQSLQPGYIFDLGRDLRQAVIIRANGVRIGEGELVDLSGRTGVVLLSLLGKHE